ncbi:MAG: hypothetical protein JW940_21200 [Polyangiaceae bacterium]|nr:hypothetical protein [Polyangiaceae bacterium]
MTPRALTVDGQCSPVRFASAGATCLALALLLMSCGGKTRHRSQTPSAGNNAGAWQAGSESATGGDGRGFGGTSGDSGGSTGNGSAGERAPVGGMSGDSGGSLRAGSAGEGVSDGGAGGAEGTYADIHEFMDALVPPTCSKLLECLPELSESLELTLGSCAQIYSDSYRDQLEAPGVIVDPDQWPACVHSTEQMTCDERIYDRAYGHDGLETLYGPARTPCGAHGTLRTGEPCVYDLQCASGLCRSDSADIHCGSCGTTRGLGAECDGSGEEPCEPGLQCNEGICAPTRYLSESCASLQDCRYGLYCIDGRCSKGRAEGETCTTDLPCDSRIYLGCSTDGRCVPYEVVGEYEKCAGKRCGPALYCDPMFADPVCRPWLPEGAVCGPLSSLSEPRCAVGLNCVDSHCMRGGADTCASSSTP